MVDSAGRERLPGTRACEPQFEEQPRMEDGSRREGSRLEVTDVYAKVTRA